MKAIKCQLKMKCDMPGQTIQGLLEYVYSQPIIAGHPKQVSVRNHFTEFCLLDSSGSQPWNIQSEHHRQNIDDWNATDLYACHVVGVLQIGEHFMYLGS